MRFSIMHVSDLHRDLTDELNNMCLLESIARDIERYGNEGCEILKPSLCIVSGDLVYGTAPDATDPSTELQRQYNQAEDFLVGLSDRFFDGDRDRLVIMPGNHDISFHDVVASTQQIPIPTNPQEKTQLVDELFRPQSRLRWSWRDLCFYRIIDEDRYRGRLAHFAELYERFYEGQRAFSLDPEQQFDVFDFPELEFTVITLNSCYDNDPFRRTGAFHPVTITQATHAARASERAGWLIAAAWHHNIAGGPNQDDYVDIEILQILIDAGVSLGFNGHRHQSECVEERYRIGPSTRKISVVSAGSLCAGPHDLAAATPRSFNIIELDTHCWKGRIHQRQMVNKVFNLPVWGPGHFIATGRSFADFELCKPLIVRPPQLNLQLVLERADKLLGLGRWKEAAKLLGGAKGDLVARRMLQKALVEMQDAHLIVKELWPPQTDAEAVVIGGAIIDGNLHSEAKAFIELELVKSSGDSSVREISRRIQERWFR